MRLLYVVPYLNDPAVHRRIRMLLLGGATAVVPVGFRRTAEPVDEIDGQPTIDLGRTTDGDFARRIVAVAGGVRAVSRWGPRVGPVDAVLARSLESMALARAFRRRYAPAAPLAYESLDIHRLLLGDGPAARLLRAYERRGLNASSLLVTSSSGFVREYFAPHHPHLPPVAVLENRILAGELAPEVRASLTADRLTAHPPPGPPWVIGWFGLLRCTRSLHLLAAACRQMPDLIRVEIRGRPAVTVGDEVAEVAAATPGMTFHGSYDRRTDLARMYADVHFAWTPDFSEQGANSDWLLPNRLYESGAFGCVPISSNGVETARWLTERHAGVVLQEPLDTSLGGYLKSLDGAGYANARRALLRVPMSNFVDHEETAKAVLRQLVSPPARPSDHSGRRADPTRP